MGREIQQTVVKSLLHLSDPLSHVFSYHPSPNATYMQRNVMTTVVSTVVHIPYMFFPLL